MAQGLGGSRGIAVKDDATRGIDDESLAVTVQSGGHRCLDVTALGADAGDEKGHLARQ